MRPVGKAALAALILAASLIASPSQAEQPGTSATWLLGTWKGALGGQPDSTSAARQMRFVAADPDGTVLAQWSIDGAKWSRAKVDVAGDVVAFVNNFGSTGTLRKAGESQLAGTLTNNEGRMFEFSLRREPSSQAASADPILLTGVWLATVDAEARTRTMDLRSVAKNGVGTIEGDAYYGWTAETVKDLQKVPIKIRQINGSTFVYFTSGAGSKVAAQLGADGRLDGVIKYKNGVERQITFARTDVDALANNRYRIAPNSKMMVIYVGAWDCSYCRQWEGMYQSAYLKSPKYRGVAFREISAASFTWTGDSSFWPNDLKWVQAKTYTSRGTPRFIVVVDKTVVLNTQGLFNWERRVLPAIDSLLAQLAHP